MDCLENTLRLSSGYIIAHPKNKLEFVVEHGSETNKITLFGKGIWKLIAILPDVEKSILEASQLAEADQELQKVVYKSFLACFNATAYILEVQTYNGKPYCFIKRFFTLPENPSEWLPTKLMFQIDIGMMEHFKLYLRKYYVMDNKKP